MPNLHVSPRTLIFKVYCTCDGCKNKFEKLRKQNRGVDSLSVDTEEGKVIITGNLDPSGVIEDFRKYGKRVELLSVERYPKKGLILERAGIPIPPSTKVEDLKRHSKKVEVSSITKSIRSHQSYSKERAGILIPPSTKMKDLRRHGKEVKALSTKESIRLHQPYPKGSYIQMSRCNRCMVKAYYCTSRPQYGEVHEECRYPKATITPQCLDGRPLNYRPSDGKERWCYACGKRIRGHFYGCNGVYVHPCCGKIPIRHGSSGDVQLLLQRQPRPSPTKCLLCRKKTTDVSGLCYASTRDECSIHVKCLLKLLRQAVKEGEQKNDSKKMEEMNSRLVAKSMRKGGKNRVGFWRSVVSLGMSIARFLLGDFTGLASLPFGITKLLLRSISDGTD